MKTQASQVNEHPTTAFLHRLDPSAKHWVFQIFRNDTPGQGRHFKGSWEVYQDELTRLNSLGYDIFVTVNDALGREKKDVKFCRTLWQEDDGNAQIPAIPPQLVVQTSPGHFHRYWLHELLGYPSAEWDNAQDWMVKEWGSDPNAKDASRVLRLPGFWNHKRDCECILVEADETFPIYTWEMLTKELRVPPVSEKPTKSGGPSSQDDSGLAKYLQQIASGEHLHGPIRAIMMINANNGLDSAANEMVCKGYILAWPGDPVRQQKAMADLQSMLTATYRKVVEDAIPAVKQRKYEENVPIPPGNLGLLAQAANDFFVVPNMTAAVMTSLSLVAGIVGRRYNISSSGLNLYTTIMMPTGAGKDSIRKFCQRVLMDMSLLGANGLSFLGSQNFTGPKALLNELTNKPSMLCVMTEAGLLYKSDSGDRMGLTRVILQAYTSSGEKEFIEAEQYSKTEDSIQQVRSPALTILNEATPVTLLNELHKRESLNTGELPRMWIFMLDGAKPYNNPNPHQLSLADEILYRIKELVTDCYTVQNSLPPSVIHIERHSETQAYTNWCTDRYNELIEQDSNRAMLYSRGAHKVMKAAAICSLFNGNVGYIDDASWNWAKSLFEYEMQQVDRIIGAGSEVNDAISKIADVIVRILHGEYGVTTNKNRLIPEAQRKQGIFTASAFKQITFGIPAIKRLGSGTKYSDPKSGGRVALQMMEYEGLIESMGSSVKSSSGKGRPSELYRITSLFRHLYRDVL